MGTEQDVTRAEQLYKRGAEQGNATAKLLTDQLKNKNGRGCTQMNLGSEQEKAHDVEQRCELNLVFDRSRMRCYWRQSVGLDAADERAADNTGPSQ